MRKYLLFLLLFLCLGIKAKSQDEIVLIKDRISEWNQHYEVDKRKLLSEVKDWTKTLQKNQQWEDVDYKNPTRSTWTAFIHLKRVKEMTIAYTADWSPLKNDVVLFSAIQSALQFWNKAQLKNINWWWNEIEAPRTIGGILIMLDQNKGEKLHPELREKLIQQMDYKRKNGDTGVNLADFDTHLFYMGLLNRNESQIQSALQNIFSINKKTIKEGIQYDNSYAQHQIMLHIFGYGSEFLKVEAYIAAMVAQTKFALKGEELKVFSDFITQSLIPQIRGKVTNYTSLGRQIARENYTLVDWLIPYFKKLIDIDPNHSEIYQASIKRLSGEKKPSYHTPSFQKHYWNTDFGFYQNKDYQFSVRLSSVFTQQAETDMNGENTKGGYRSIGSYETMLSGNEYLNIFPIWDWAKIPGTTVLKNAKIPNTAYLSPGKSTFAGGVSNGKVGVTAFQQNQFGVSAKKAWFMFDGQVVCLGSGISSDKQEEIVTTVEQNFFDKNVKIKLLKGENTAYFHRDIAYIFKKGSPIKMSTNTQKGRWSDLSDIQSNRWIEAKVFKLWLEHEASSLPQQYEYIISPKVSSAAKAQRVVEDFEVRNTSKVQAVLKKTTGQLMLVFYEPAEIDFLGKQIKVDKACSILIEDFKNPTSSLQISDPSRTQKEIHLVINDQNIHVNLPTDRAFAGSTVYYKSK